MAALPFSLPSLPWKYIVPAVAVIGVFLFYGEMRADGREEKVNARWEAAALKLEKQSEESADQAEGAAVVREEGFAKKLSEEKEKIDAAIESDSSVFDVMFDTGSVSDGSAD